MTDDKTGEEIPIDIEKSDDGSPRGRIEEEAERAVDELERGVVDLLAWLLDTETRSRIYIFLRKHPKSTSEEVAEGTGLYPSTVREALAELHDEGTVTREKREGESAGNTPYEYDAIPPRDLVGEVLDQLQSQLNGILRLDDRFATDEPQSDEEPITISVDDEALDDGSDEQDDRLEE